MKQYRQKPIEVEAVQWLGINREEMKEFCPTAVFKQYHFAFDPGCRTELILEDGTVVEPNGFLVKAPSGRYYAYSEKIFYNNYEEVDDK